MSELKKKKIDDIIGWCTELRNDYNLLNNDIKSESGQIKTMILNKLGLKKNSNEENDNREDVGKISISEKTKVSFSDLKNNLESDKDSIIKSLKETNDRLFNVNDIAETRFKETKENNELLVERIFDLESELKKWPKEKTEPKGKPLEKIKERYLSSVSHNFRTPLTSIISSARIIKKYGNQNSETIDKFVKIILDESDRLLELIINCQDILNLNEIETELQTSLISPIEVFDGIISKNQKKYVNKNVNWKLSKPEILSEINIDYFWFSKILSHLIKLVIGIQDSIDIFASINSEKNNNISFEIKNTEDPCSNLISIEKWLDELSYDNCTLADGKLGTDLVLDICNKVIKKHNGYILINTDYPETRYLKIVIPATPILNKDIEGVNSSVEKNNKTKKTILHVDDDKNLIDVVRLLLINEPYDIVNTTRGDLAKELALEHNPDLILLDIMMPDMSGYVVLGQLKNDTLTKDIPVIALSVSSEREKSLKSGAKKHITKPMNEKKLISAIKELISQS